MLVQVTLKNSQKDKILSILGKKNYSLKILLHIYINNWTNARLNYLNENDKYCNTRKYKKCKKCLKIVFENSEFR